MRCEGAPIPLKPRKRWDDGRNVLLAGDACGVVAPASGEGIYYAMLGGRLAAEAVGCFLETGDAKTLLNARKQFETAWSCLLDSRIIAAILVFHRCQAREVCFDVQRSGRTISHLASIYPQRIGACPASCAYSDLLQGCGSAARACSSLIYARFYVLQRASRLHAALTCGGIFSFCKDRRFAFSFLPFFCAGAALILALGLLSSGRLAVPCSVSYFGPYCTHIEL